MKYTGYECNNEIKKTIKQLSIQEEIPISKICETLKILPQSYQNIYKKQKLSFIDIQEILDVLGYDLEINFIKKTT